MRDRHNDGHHDLAPFGIVDTHDGDKVYAVTRHGQVLSTKDAGKSWGVAQLPYEAGDAFCVAGN